MVVPVYKNKKSSYMLFLRTEWRNYHRITVRHCNCTTTALRRPFTITIIIISRIFLLLPFSLTPKMVIVGKYYVMINVRTVQNIIFLFMFFSVTLYSVHSRVDNGNLELIHSILHFPPKKYLSSALYHFCL